jgi:DNA-binding transcriptional regulator YhcF (GntR family)
MTRDPDDKRTYYQQIVDDIKAQIRDGRLQPNEALPSARAMAEDYNVGIMSVQRALRELQNLRLTYARPGKGTFVHPDAFDYLQGAVTREPVGEDDPQLRRDVADYLATQQEILVRFHSATTTKARNAALNELVAHADKHRDLIERAARYQTSHGRFAQDPFAERTAAGKRPTRTKHDE